MKKVFLLIWLPVAILLGGILGLIYYSELNSGKTILENNGTSHVTQQIKSVTVDLNHVVSDLIVLSEQHELQELLDKSHDYSTKDLANDYLSLSLRKALYDQIRFIDEKGMEVVRVNYNDCEPCIVPDEELQFKGNRYYFRDTFELDQGEVFVSPFDLNIERGTIEKPLKPMIRFGTPVFDGKGRKRGIVILNYLGSVLLDNIKGSNPGKTMFLNAAGYWLLSPNPEDEWGFMFEERQDKRFANVFPDAWQQISKAESGQFYNAYGLFTFATVYPLLEGQKSSTGSKEPFVPSAARLGVKDYYWKIVSHVTHEALYERVNYLFWELVQLYAVLLVLAAIGAWVIAKANLRHKEAEEALKDNERKYRSLAESTKTVPWKLDLATGRFTYIGRHVEEILGFPAESWVDINTWNERIPPEDREEATRFRSEATKRGEDYDFEYRLVAADGRVVWIRDIVSVVKENDLPKELIGVMIDITERKNAEEGLRKLSTIVEQNPASIVITDTEGTIEYVNPKFEQVTGYSAGEAIGQNPRVLKSDEQPAEFYKELWDTITSGKDWRGDFRNKKKNGEIYWESASISPIKDGEGKITHFLAIKLDVTSRKKMEESFRRAKEEAEEATRLKDKFVSLVSHDLKNPIHRIMGYYELLESTQQISKQGKELIEEGLFACKDMTTLIDEILNLSRIKGGRIMPEYAFINAHIMADSAIKDYALMASEKGIDLTNDIPKDSRIYADEKLLGEVLRNLISNSVKFCEKGDIIRLYLSDGEADTIAVADTGRGMEAEWLKTLFNYEEKTSTIGTSGESGTGFGLPLARDIMKAHGGDLHVESTLDEGSTFYASLPHVRPTVLIVDDDKLAIRMLKDFLVELDLDFIEAENGREAVDVLEKTTPHLILQDIIMPDMDGLELLKHVRSKKKTKVMPVIVITADKEIETRDRVFDLGADDFITKPLNIEDLIPRVRRFVG